MAKKSFGSGFDSLLSGDSATHNEKIPKKSSSVVKTRAAVKESTVAPILDKEESCASLDDEFSREIKTSVLLLETLYEQIQALAYWERKLIKDVIVEALDQHLQAKGSKWVEDAVEAFRKK